MGDLDEKKEEMGLLKVLLVIFISFIVGITGFIVNEIKSDSITVLSFIGVIGIGVFSISLVLVYFQVIKVLGEIKKL